MSIILNIETSGKICSVALTKDGYPEFHIESEENMRHAELLGEYVEKCMEYLTRREEKLDAVAVSIGPGSYTGLRIGLSLAKGLCYSLDIPMIGVSTLKILGVKAMFSNFEWTGSELLVPMIDARRQEVYTAVYDFALNPVLAPTPLILDSASFHEYLTEGKHLIAIGDGTAKAREIIREPGIKWLSTASPLAIDMTALSELAFRNKDFLDIAYSVPEYLKDYQTTQPKNRVLGKC